MRLYEKYFARQIYVTFVFILFAFSGLFFFFDLISELNSVGHGNYKFGYAVLRVALQTPLAPAEGEIVDPAIPLLAVPMLRSGLGLWQGAQGVIPAAQVAHWGEGVDGLPAAIDARSGVLVLAPEVATGSSLLALLERLSALGVEGDRLRVITALAASAGLKAIGERFDHLTLYTACIDPDLDASGRPVPGIGSIQERLFGTSQSSAAAIGA